MGALLTAVVPIFFLMALPLIIPAAALAIGAITDKVRPPTPGPAQSVVQAAWDRSAKWRAENEAAQAEAIRNAKNPG